MAEWAPRCDRVVRLDDSGKPEREGLLVVPLGCDVVLQLSPSRLVDPTTIRLWTNAPLDADTTFCRSRFRPVRGTDESHRDGDWVARIPVLLPGSLEFFIEFQPMRDGTLTAEPAHKAAPHADSPFGDAAWRRVHGRAVENVAVSSPHAPSAAARRGPMVRLLVHPRLGAWVDPEASPDGIATPPGEPASPSSDAASAPGARRLHSSILRGSCASSGGAARAALSFRHVPLDGLMLQTNLTRCLGPLSEWDEQLAETVTAGFNMVHLTPPQQLGASGSAYSVFDQLTLADSLWGDGPPPADRDSALRATLQRLERKHGLLFMADLVLNHTASDSAFLADQPECAFTLRNSPWLRPAAALDGAIARVSATAAAREGGWPITCESDVAGVLARLRDGDEGLRSLRLWEYYVAAPAPQLAALAAWAAGPEWRRKAGVAAATDAPVSAPGIDEAAGSSAPDEVDAAPALATMAPGSAGSADSPIRVGTLGAGDAWTSAECSRAAGRIAAAAARAGAVARPLSAASAAAVARDLTAASAPPGGWKCAAGPGSDSRLLCAGAWNTGTGARFPVRIAPAAMAAALDSAADDTGGPILWHLVGRVAAGNAEGGAAEARACARAMQAVGAAVDAVNAPFYARYDDDVATALRGVESAAKQLWLSERRGRSGLSAEHPLVWAYFERAGRHAVACNGFVWGGDPKIDFTLPTDAAHAYAELAFRLADQPCVDDSAEGTGRWARMEEYSRRAARLFQAVRLDNAHGTPPWVARRMLDAAREERPLLYVNAELFTNSVQDDVRYASMLGINSLVRETVHAGDEAALSAALHPSAAGGTPSGSLRHADTWIGAPGDPARSLAQECLPSAIPQILFDLTHDNPSLLARRSAHDTLPTAALVAAAACASGSVRGFDRLAARNPSVVTDYRLYQQPAGLPAVPEGILAARRRLSSLSLELAATGMVEVHVHREPVREGGDLLVVTRGHPSRPDALVFICRSAFSAAVAASAVAAGARMPALRIEGVVESVDMAARLSADAREVERALAAAPDVSSGSAAAAAAIAAARRAGAAATAEQLAAAFVTGVPCKLESAGLGSEAAVDGEAGCGSLPLGMGSWRVETVGKGGPTVSLVELAPAFRPGSVLVLRVSAPRNAQVPLRLFPHPLRAAPSQGAVCVTERCGSDEAAALPAPSAGAAALKAGFGPPLAELETALGLDGAIERFHDDLRGGKARAGSAAAAGLGAADGLPSLADLAVLLFRVDAEERDDSAGEGGVYGVPGWGQLPWAGLAGFEAVLRSARGTNDLGHPLCENLRQGTWAMDFICARLRRRPGLDRVRRWLQSHFAVLRRMPPGLRPQGFDRVVSAAYNAAVACAVAHMRAGGSALLGGDPHARDSAAAAGVAGVAGVAGSAAGASAAGKATGPRPGGAIRAEDSGSDARSDPWALSSVAALHRKGSHPAALVDLAADNDGGSPAGHARDRLVVFAPPSSSPPFVVSLALTSVMLFSQTPSAPLLAPRLLQRRSPADADEANAPASCAVTSGGGGGGGGACDLAGPFAASGSLCAGVDHFCTGFMRNWGRDTCISLRGLLLLTGRFAEARRTLLALGAVVRHGLVPNLLDGGRNPRYNARDATWWWLQAVVDFVRLAPPHAGGGQTRDTLHPHILDEMVAPRFPSDNERDYEPHATGAFTGPAELARPRSLGSIVCGVLAAHARGIHFREWRAGRGIDAHMRDGGFTVEVRRDERSGILQGGNGLNCGTWMDKMGESPRHGTDGLPATPRDGAPVELTGLLFSVLAWAAEAAKAGLLPLAAAALPGGHELSWSSWRDDVRSSFERRYWVPLEAEPDALRGHAAPAAADCEVDAAVVNGRGIYKDTVGSSTAWADYQLRPNFLVAMAVAPELFSPGRAAVALAAVERQLLGRGPGQMGVKTLDPGDWAYRGVYTNQESKDRATAAGWNYHQGPEWLWPFGYYLRARLHFPPRAAVAALVPDPQGRGAAEAGEGAPPIGAKPSTAASRAARAIVEADLDGVLGISPTADGDGDDGEEEGGADAGAESDGDTSVPPSPSLLSSRWSKPAARRWVLAQLREHRHWIEHSAHGGLPELTNAEGAVCEASCVVQAWSSATVLDALYAAEFETA